MAGKLIFDDVNCDIALLLSQTFRVSVEAPASQALIDVNVEGEAGTLALGEEDKRYHYDCSPTISVTIKDSEEPQTERMFAEVKMGISVSCDSEDLNEKTAAERLMRAAVKTAYSFARTYVANSTSVSPMGRTLTLPEINVAKRLVVTEEKEA